MKKCKYLKCEIFYSETVGYSVWCAIHLDNAPLNRNAVEVIEHFEKDVPIGQNKSAKS